MQLPESQHSTINAIYQHYELQQTGHGWRAHLGASIIGKSCERALWYDFHWCSIKSHKGQMLRLFETGHLAEDRFAANLRAAGVKVWTVDPNTGKQFRVSACQDHFGGSMDGVGHGFLEAPSQWHIIEMKTHSEKSFKGLEKDGVQKSKPQHFTQMQVYMHLQQIDRAYYIAVNKNTDALYGERVKYDKSYAENTLAKAARIIASDQPLDKLNDDPSWWECKLCDHHAICHGEQVPAVNCRTCLHASAVDHGQWHCARFNLLIPENNQRVGCQAHLFIPDLIQSFADVMDSGEYWIRYCLKKTGECFVSGEDPRQFKSTEIRAVEDKSLLADKTVNMIREAFNAELMEDNK
ncbi:hypothetical protein [Zooshikella ganghwensis]|uniref:hypothetical protein n=1 Tax=Zooshikella ganghwensis TaxID=202772 RepID=UPI000412E2BA|nr:hypothetical protein [Zooshikella ganghwensis]